MKKISLLTILTFILLIGAAQADKTSSVEAGPVQFSVPSEWASEPVTSPVRAAQIRVPGAGEEDGEISFFYFGPDQGGDRNSNIERWSSQFSVNGASAKPDIQIRTIGDFKGTLVRLSGDYNSGKMSGQDSVAPNTYFIGAIVGTERGSVFVKFIGRETTVKKNDAAFVEMIDSATPAKKS